KQEALKGKEKKLASLLKEIFEAMQPIEPRIGKPVDDIKKTPFGYELIPDADTFEYGGDYSNTEIQRGSGFGTADEKSFPKVHVDRAGLVQKGAGILRSDWEVIDLYRREIGRVEKKLKLDGAPELEGGPYGPANHLEKGANKDRGFNRGVRKQM